LVIVDAKGDWRFNFMDWEASRPDEGGGLSINIVNLPDEIAGAISGSAGHGDGGNSGSNKFWEDALHHMNTNLVELPLFAGIEVSLPLLRSIVITAPYSTAQTKEEEWKKKSACARILREADEATAQGLKWTPLVRQRNAVFKSENSGSALISFVCLSCLHSC
jgi:hypothetical protein